MKLIVSGATGFVASEVIRQGLKRPEITSIVALARKEVLPPPGAANSHKLKSVVLQDYGVYSQEAKRDLSGANACIWTVAITPSASVNFDFATVKHVCQESTLAGLKALGAAGTGTPFRFVYMSGALSERDQTKTPKVLPEYCLMRGKTESLVLEYAAEHKDFQAEIVKPGLILAPGQPERKLPSGLPNITIDITEVAASMLDQVILGFEKETLDNDDMVRIGRAALAKATE